MAEYLFDTNIVAERSLAAMPQRAYVSAVVLTELMTAGDADEFKVYQVTWQRQAQAGKLIAPAVEDWPHVARILHLIAQDRKKKAKGKSLRRSPAAKQELAMDVLIAVSAAREGVTVVTNDNDFDAIRYYHKKLKIKSGAEFFS
ncbi:MAG TPA: PIN domain-containing protein [Pyrinomonadaceae bacterium]|jgi:predicted nucleic acid-binding protein|nr:PIN domain-containing protein [Pyrinomonadaceae bacterium]